MSQKNIISYFALILLFIFLGCKTLFSQKVYISEVFYDTPLYEDSWGTMPHHNGEFIELYNPSSLPSDISGMIIKDRDTPKKIIIPEGSIMQPNSFFLIVFGNPGFNIKTLFPSIQKNKSIYYHDIIRLTNYKEGIYLYDQDECVIDSMIYGNLPKGHKLYARNKEDISITNASHCMSLHRHEIKRDSNGNGTFSQGQWIYSKVSPFSSEYIKDNTDDYFPGDPFLNYITTRTFLSADGTIFTDNVEYFDGLGRPFQQVAKGITPNKSNLATLQNYDGFGKLNKKWLAIPTSSDFYSVQDTNQIKEYYDDVRPFVEYVYDASPLNRITEEVQIGANCWNQHSIKTDYLTNNTKEDHLKCKYFDIVKDKLNDAGFYKSGELYVTKTIDGVGNESYVFKDKLDRQILIRQIGRSIFKERDNHDTYFVYDDFGNLRYVLPPMMNGDVNGLELYGYQYFYDTRNRCIEKVLPGGVRYCYIYDKADRVRLMQDGNQREKGEWNFIKYDGFGREIQTGVFTSKLSSSELEKNITNDQLTERIQPNNPDWYTNQSFPKITTTTTIHTVKYYDNYEYINTLSEIHQANSELNKLYCDSECESAKGLLTCKKVYVEKDDNYIFTKYRYDYRGNPIQVIETRENGGYLNEYYQYSFTGNILQKRTENNFCGYKEPDVTETYRYSYDHADRLDTTYYSFKILDKEEQSFVMSLNIYNELGQLEEKKLHKESANFLNSINYKYNILGGVSEIDDFCSKQSINYTNNNNYLNNITQVIYEGKNDGVITGEKNQYNYRYDELNRLTSANYSGDKSHLNYSELLLYDKNGNIKIKGNNYNEDYSQKLIFDYNGNQIKNITNTCTPVNYYKNQMFQDKADAQLEYQYDNVGNMIVDLNKGISRIKYNNSNIPELVQMQNGNQIKYKYDVEGRKLKQTDLFTRENIDCPIGEAKDLEEGQIINRAHTEYIGNVIYKYQFDYYPPLNDRYESSIHRISIAEGHIEKDQYGNYEIKYHLTDHLGNVRAEIGLDNRASEQTNYYPFGMEWGRSSKIEFAYNGKEKMETHGFNMYDYGARFYDQTIGRWHSMDPLAEKYYSISPYAYCLNNPVIFVDPKGLEPTKKEAAAMSAHVYGDQKDNILIGGWRVSSLTSFNANNHSGLKGMMYERVKDGEVTEYCYAIAGTEDINDVIENIAQLIGMSQQHSEMTKITESITKNEDLKVSEVTFTGHSLGGGLAALAAMKSEKNAMTFNAAGLSPITLFKHSVNPSKSTIDANIMINDPLNIVQLHIGIPANGNKHYVMPKGSIGGHSITNMYHSLK